MWRDDGLLPDAGLLIHVFDGWEDGEKSYLPTSNGPGAVGMSCSMIFAEQLTAGNTLTRALFNGGATGIILRPGVTKLNCGKPDDTGGECKDRVCPWRSKVEIPFNEGEDKFCNWPPKTFGVELQRLTEWQAASQRLMYNEIIVDSPHWRAHMPDIIEGIYGNRQAHEEFLRAYASHGVSTQTHPFLAFDPSNWKSPFSIA
jgi:hypothetical protein